MARRKRRIRMGAIDRDDIMNAAGKMKHFCLKKWDTKQFVSACSKTVDVMTKNLLAQGPELTAHNVAAAANKTDKKCESYKADRRGRNQYGSVCFRVVGGFIRLLSQSKPGLQGRR